MNILLDYVFPITAIVPTPAASTAFLKQVLVVVKPKDMVPTGEITLCTTPAQVDALTDNAECLELFNAGMSRMYVLTADNLNIASFISESLSDFYTILVGSEFGDEYWTDVLIPEVPAVAASATIQDITYEADEEGVAGNGISIQYVGGGSDGLATVLSVSSGLITVEIETAVTTATAVANAVNGHEAAGALVTGTVAEGQGSVAQVLMADPVALTNGIDFEAAIPARNFGQFSGVVGLSTNDVDFAEAQAVIAHRVAFLRSATNNARNMFFAFGRLLSNVLNWRNQQYIEMPIGEDIATLGEANFLFDERVSFVLSDDQFAHRLGLFAAGGKAIVAPYIVRNLEVDLQSRALQYISGNQPAYSIKEASLLEAALQETVIDRFIAREWITAGNIQVRLEQDNFVASGYINIAEPKALWRIFGEMRQTL